MRGQLGLDTRRLIRSCELVELHGRRRKPSCGDLPQAAVGGRRDDLRAGRGRASFAPDWQGRIRSARLALVVSGCVTQEVARYGHRASRPLRCPLPVVVRRSLRTDALVQRRRPVRLRPAVPVLEASEGEPYGSVVGPARGRLR